MPVAFGQAGNRLARRQARVEPHRTPVLSQAPIVAHAISCHEPSLLGVPTFEWTDSGPHLEEKDVRK